MKKGIKIFTLDDYIEQKTLTLNQKEIIVQAIKDKLNILIVGPVSSGKTTFANAVGDEIPEDERVAGLIAIGWFAFNQMADHETSRTAIKIGSIVLIIIAIWFIEPTVKALGGSTIAIEYIKAIK